MRGDNDTMHKTAAVGLEAVDAGGVTPHGPTRLGRDAGGADVMSRNTHPRAPVSATVLAGGGAMGALMRALDWAATPIGPVERWPQSLRTAVSICLASRFPMIILWGRDLIQLYNDGYGPILGTKHPRAMGQPTRACWPEVWDFNAPIYDAVMARGEVVYAEDQLFCIARGGYVEEAYFTLCYSPIRDESGGVGGILVTVLETTRRVLGERRLRTLRDLAAAAGTATTAWEACATAARALAGNAADIPFALLYLLDATGTEARLAGTAGLKPGTPTSPSVIALAPETSAASPWPLARALRTGPAAVAPGLDARRALPGGQGDTPGPHTALVVPVTPAGQDRPAGLLVAGVNPQRALDDDYRGFFDLVAQQIARSLADAQTVEEMAEARATLLRQAEEGRAQAEAAVRLRDEVLSVTAHDLRSPLTILVGRAQLVQQRLAGPRALDPAWISAQVQSVVDTARRMLDTISDLSDVVQVRLGGALDLDREPVDLSALLRAVAVEAEADVETPRVTVVALVAVVVEGDRARVRRVLENIVGNALKYSPAPTPIQATVRVHEQTAVITVRDRGVGIPDAELPHIFTRYYRASTAQGVAGSGLGLAGAQAIVAQHGGTIVVESVAGQGTTIVLTLPYVPTTSGMEEQEREPRHADAFSPPERAKIGAGDGERS